MTRDETLPQSDNEERQAIERSLRAAKPPVEVPGYDVQSFLGSGTYGQVWVGVERNTGRSVAIKFYTNRAGLDWSLLSREVEKLVFLAADRYVVQVLGVGWESDPPYYIMEFVERGSLETYLGEGGTLDPREAVRTWRDVAVGLIHAHSKGVLHCDLKPANVLLDQDGKARLADFGQSRLVTEQSPSLGTLFYMAPEQADLKAVPDSRWDVYALGALMYRMLTGSAPHQTPKALADMSSAVDLSDRLARYRHFLWHAPRPKEHIKLRGVDRALADIVSRCLRVNPNHRYPNVQAVVDDLDLRDHRRARRPLLALGAVGPALLLILLAFLFFLSVDAMLKPSRAGLMEHALNSNHFAAQYAARWIEKHVEEQFEAVERLAAEPGLQRDLESTANDPQLSSLMARFADPHASDEELEPLRRAYREKLEKKPNFPPARLMDKLHQVVDDQRTPEAASWCIADRHGNLIARWPPSEVVGRNYSWRAYFHGGEQDKKDRSWRPPDENEIVPRTSLSPVFKSQATNKWIVTASTPVRSDIDQSLLGVAYVTFEVGRLTPALPRSKQQQFVVLVNRREGDHKGLVMQHPLVKRGAYPERFLKTKYYVTDERFPQRRDVKEYYRDPLGQDYNKRWLAENAPVVVRGKDIGWSVIVQQAYEEAIGSTLDRILSGLLSIGVIYLALFGTVVAALWCFVLWSYAPGGSSRRLGHAGLETSSTSSSELPRSEPTPNQPATHAD